jgi:DNA-directed RNA polymerase subunit M
MLPKKSENGIMLVCNTCGYSEKAEKLESYSIVKKAGRDKSITMIEEKTEPTLPTTRAKCPSCGHDVAYWWLRQTRAGDEPSTRFYRCVKCGKVWREYS